MGSGGGGDGGDSIGDHGSGGGDGYQILYGAFFVVFLNFNHDMVNFEVHNNGYLL